MTSSASHPVHSIGAEDIAGRHAGWLLIFIALFAGVLRLRGLGESSLWLDELCTWHASRLPFADGLTWGPEVTIPPLYQWSIRLLSSADRPSEWLLRFPAWAAGTAVVPVVYFLTRNAAGRMTALSAATLAAVQPALVRYSQEARPYTLLVLSGAASVTFLLRFHRLARPGDLAGFVAASALGLYAHLLMLPMLAAALGWSLLQKPWRNPRVTRWHVLAVLPAIAVLTAPVWIRAAWFAEEARSAVDWIEPATVGRAWSILAGVSFGPVWAGGLLGGIAVWIAWAASKGRVADRGDFRVTAEGARSHRDVVLLMMVLLAVSWGGLLALSWLGRPLMVERYALPAAIPAVILPLLLLDRVHRYLPVAAALAVVVGTSPDWVRQGRLVEPGLRELVEYLHAESDPAHDVVLLAVDHSELPGWDEAQFLPFAYYGPTSFEVQALKLDGHGNPIETAWSRDPRRLNVIVFRCDGVRLIEDGGRTVEPMAVQGRLCQQLPFGTHRLLRAAALPAP